MKHFKLLKTIIVTGFILFPVTLLAQKVRPSTFSFQSTEGLLFLLIFILIIMLAAVIYLRSKVIRVRNQEKQAQKNKEPKSLETYVKTMNSELVEKCLDFRHKKGKNILIALSLLLLHIPVYAQTNQPVPTPGSMLGEGGVIITLILLAIPILGGIILLVVKLNNTLLKYQNKKRIEEAKEIITSLKNMPEEEVDKMLHKKKEELNYQLHHNELSGDQQPEDKKGLLSFNRSADLPIVAPKKKALKRPDIDPRLSKLVLWFLGSATFWLLFGTTIGEYLGIKFVAPDADHVSWLSFGRLRPVHTNSVFWGWASLAMLGLAYYTVPRVSNTRLASFKLGWYSLWLVNASVLIGSICLMAGVNNGGGEYREYVWPVMLLFAIALVLTLINFLKTIAQRTTREIYISNWYIVSSIIFTIVIALVAYIPTWQNGLGETIVQGYYMHQGVGMWFMFFTLGLVYYFLPQQLNKPIYSYSLGILAFWTQILFYTLIGSHHFVFSSIPWWLQTVAIVGSAGMVIPVMAGSTNFIMTFKNAWYKVQDSYTLPFFLVGTIFYFTGSLQGTAEAFRTTNLVWHFTDFTVAHSHLTMYGIITFFAWACIYAIVPRLTGREAPQITIGAHFWLALIGLLFYTIPLMYGSTLKGLMWMNGKPFIESVVMMAPYWLWRAIGGSLMWISHLFFAYNMYLMFKKSKVMDLNEAIFQEIEKENPISLTDKNSNVS